MNARLKYDRREFNRPMCYMDESGECSDEPISTSCEKSEFTYCLNGWTCHYYCAGERQVYNSRDNLCQDLQSCHKSMRYDLWSKYFVYVCVVSMLLEINVFWLQFMVELWHQFAFFIKRIFSAKMIHLDSFQGKACAHSLARDNFW